MRAWDASMSVRQDEFRNRRRRPSRVYRAQGTRPLWCGSLEELLRKRHRVPLRQSGDTIGDHRSRRAIAAKMRVAQGRQREACDPTKSARQADNRLKPGNSAAATASH